MNSKARVKGKMDFWIDALDLLFPGGGVEVREETWVSCRSYRVSQRDDDSVRIGINEVIHGQNSLLGGLLGNFDRRSTPVSGMVVVSKI